MMLGIEVVMAENFVLVMVLLCGLTALGGIRWLMGSIPPRTTADVVMNLVADIALLSWGLFILGSAHG